MASLTKKRRLDSEFNLIEDIEPEKKRKMFCWGSSQHGQLGLGGIEEENIFVPREVNFIKATEVDKIACGTNHTVLNTLNGQIYSCGNNDDEQLGHNEPIMKKLVQISNLKNQVIKNVACGASHTLALNEWGQLFSWGCNLKGQLGLDSSSNSERFPVLIKKILATKMVVQIACGLNHNLVLTNIGEIYSWGSNDHGQLGLGPEQTMVSKPTLVRKLAGLPIAFIACGGYHSIVVSKSGAVFGWGKNRFGQLGLNHLDQKCFPTELVNLRNSRVCYVACGEEFSAFLTKDGGVFTCGSAMYGQLGHGTFTTEILPRQIVELMGSDVSQIAAGRQHLLAFVPKVGRVYSWGLNTAGQLGFQGFKKTNIPHVVLGPWHPSTDNFSTNVDGKDSVVKQIFSGGNHCFVTVTKIEENTPSTDCRIIPISSQILEITEEKLLACNNIPEKGSIDHDLFAYLETVFQSAACINGSFLLANDAHYGSSNKNHGVDIKKATRLFDLISKFQNATLTELIFSSITKHLWISLQASTSDVEYLRAFLILPLYHGFSDPENFNVLHMHFARRFLRFNSAHLKIIKDWWRNSPISYFQSLIRNFKAVVPVILKNRDKGKWMSLPWQDMLRLMVNVLKVLDELNYSSEGQRVHYSEFNVPELLELIDMESDYNQWVKNQNSSGFKSICLCDYPFLFDAEAKTFLLMMDQSCQMQSAIDESILRMATTALSHALMNRILSATSTGLDGTERNFILEVSRENLVHDTLKELYKYQTRDLKKPLKVKFRGEEAEDAGGVKKEFFELLLKEILDPKYGMFHENKETKTIWFNQFSFEDVNMYYLIGVLCGLAIYNFSIIVIPFPLALYKKLLKEPVGLSDIEEMDPVYGRSLKSILEYEESDFEEVFDLDFQISRECYEINQIFELKSNGKDIRVTLENKKEYVDLTVDYILNKSVQAQFNEFYKGFHKVCGGNVLKLFHGQELMALVVGTNDYNWQQLEEQASYQNGYTKDDLTIRLFWQVFHDLPEVEKKKFLRFLTGSDRIPIHGMKAIKITIQPMSDERYLPVAHTCFNLLDLPRYQTRERLHYKLIQAIQHNQGFSLV